MAQKIIDGAELFTQACRKHDEIIGLDDLAELVDKAPTIEAIPVEWIKKKLNKLKDDIKWSWYYGNAALKEMEWAETWVQVVLLEEWEKENGKENN